MSGNWYFWLIPGLRAVLTRPSWPVWGISVLVSGLFHLSLVATILWPGLFSPTVKSVLWLLFGTSWLTGTLVSHRHVRASQEAERRRQAEDIFPLAQRAYLRGDRAAAESLLRKQLRQCPHDVESALLLASVWRRQGRYNAARTLLFKLRTVEAARPWIFEIERELEILEGLMETVIPEKTSAENPPHAESPRPPNPATSARPPSPAPSAPPSDRTDSPDLPERPLARAA